MHVRTYPPNWVPHDFSSDTKVAEGSGAGRFYVRSKSGLHGPFTSQGLQTLVKSGELRRKHEISKDRRRWVKAGRIVDFYVSGGHVATVNHGDRTQIRTAKESRGCRGRAMEARPAQVHPGSEFAVVPALQCYGGISRSVFLGVYFGLPFVLGFIIGLLEEFGMLPSNVSPFAASLLVSLPLSVILWFGLVPGRLKNIGMSPWLCLLILVPILNLLVLIRCMVFQEGYIDSKKLDMAGRTIALIPLGVILVLFAIGMLVSIRSY